MHAIEKATKWVMLFKRITKPSTGVQLKLMRQLYLSVGVPKMTYALDTWYTPPHRLLGMKRNSGSVAVLRQMTKIQCMATIAMTGALRSTATDTLDAHANIPPTAVMMKYICRRALIRLCMVNKDHPLYCITNHPVKIRAKSLPHEPPITKMR